MKNKIICIIFFNCVLFLLIIQIFKNPVIDEYSKINKELYNLNLNQFNFYRAEEAKNLSNYINIFFCLKDFNEYNNSEFINDIYYIKETINTCLLNEECNLNDKLICVNFEMRPGEVISVYNYSFWEEKQKQKPDSLLYYKRLSVDNISYLKYFDDAIAIEAYASLIDNIKVFDSFENLEYLSIGGEFTEKDKKYLLDILPNCTIICNGETLRKISDNVT